ncbi:MAG: hypothetical protein ACR2KV_14640 [Solirubrobacteraceae bacterium]
MLLTACGGSSVAITPATLARSIAQYEQTAIDSYTPGARSSVYRSECSAIVSGAADCMLFWGQPIPDPNPDGASHGRVVLSGTRWTWTYSGGVKLDSPDSADGYTTLSGDIAKPPPASIAPQS